MSTLEMTCPDCKVPMQAGDVLYSPEGVQQLPVEWFERLPQAAVGDKPKRMAGHRREVLASRCPKCGLLRLQAP